MKRLLIIGAVMALLLAACAPAGEAPSPSRSAPPEASPTQAQPVEQPPVMAAAQVFVDQDAAVFEAQPEVVIASSEITRLELEARYPDLLPGADVEIWRLEYRLLPADMAQVAITGGRETDGQGGITEYTAQGRPYLVLSTAPDGSYSYLDVLWSTEAYERLSSVWKMSTDEAIDSVTWAIDRLTPPADTA